MSLRHHCLSRPECCVGMLRDTHGSPRTLLPTMPHWGQEAWAPRSHYLPPGVTGRGGSRPSHSGRGRGWAPPPGEVSPRPTDTGLEAPFPSPVGGGSLLAWRDTSCPTPWVTWAGEGPTCTHRPSCLRASPAHDGRGRCSCPGAGGSRPAHRSVTPAQPLKARMPVPGTLALKAACPVAFGGAQLQPREAATAPGHEAVLRHGALPASGLSATHPPGGQSRR